MGSHLNPVNNAPGQSNVYEFFGRSAMIDLGAGVVAVLAERGLQLPCLCCFAFFARFLASPGLEHGVTWEAKNLTHKNGLGL
jgi:hypothetical protein